ncbi:hypothetical protein BDD12DRAFT_934548 [Trichophaea hybrida]|nr:hypothetical protein BDD12DRAFT_934548 [Trichophaea hybrida]
MQLLPEVDEPMVNSHHTHMNAFEGKRTGDCYIRGGTEGLAGVITVTSKGAVGILGSSSGYSINLSLRTPIGDPGEEDKVHLKNISRCNGPIGPSSEYTNSWSYCIRMAFVARIGQCSGLLGATLDVRPSDIPGATQALDDDEQGAAAVVAAEELHIDGA